MDNQNAPVAAGRTTEQIAANVEIRCVEIKPYLVTSLGWKRARTRLTRIFVHLDGEGIGANFVMRHARPIDVYALLVPRIVDAANVLLRDAGSAEIGPGYRARWSQTAGCSCPCSPGFVIERSLAAHGFEIHATILPFEYELTDEQIEHAERRAERLDDLVAGRP